MTSCLTLMTIKYASYVGITTQWIIIQSQNQQNQQNQRVLIIFQVHLKFLSIVQVHQKVLKAKARRVQKKAPRRVQRKVLAVTSTQRKAQSKERDLKAKRRIKRKAVAVKVLRA